MAREDCWVCEGECARFDGGPSSAQSAVAARIRHLPSRDASDAATRRLDELLREVNRSIIGADRIDELLQCDVGKRIGDLTGAEVEFGRPAVQLTLDIATTK